METKEQPNKEQPNKESLRPWEETEKALKVAIRNSYIKMLFGDRQLAYMFMAGMHFQMTGKQPIDELDKI